MNRVKQILLTIFSVFLLTSCDLIKNALTYKDKTKEFIETLLKEDYEKSIDHFALEHETAKNTDVEALKKGLADFRRKIVTILGLSWITPL